MANPNPRPGRRFKKGEVHNPLGAGAHNKELRQVKALTQKEIAEVGSFILGNNLEALKAVRANPSSSVFKVWVCSVAITAINKGDAQALNVLLDRIVGKVKDVVENQVTATVSTVNESEVKAMREKIKGDC
jgi:predicted small secreted protein